MDHECKYEQNIITYAADIALIKEATVSEGGLKNRVLSLESKVSGLNVFKGKIMLMCGLIGSVSAALVAGFIGYLFKG